MDCIHPTEYLNMLSLDRQTLSLLEQKNLLAFSAGVDSTALFFLLLHHNIEFDIALVNYGTRKSSNQEEAYAKELADKYSKKCYTTQAPRIEQNFEKTARDFRYHFFEEILSTKGYDNLITAHQLNDQLEWLLMRLAKGAGVMELIGLEPIAKRSSYTTIRPILHHSKEELLAFLHSHRYRYFIDESNFSNDYERNYFRSEFANTFLARYQEGVKRSLEYLRNDKEILLSSFKETLRYKELVVLEYYHNDIIPKAVDLSLKSLGYLMSAAQRDEVAKEPSVVIGGAWAVERVDNQIFIAPYTTTTMPKIYKELCRTHRVPAKIRPYCFAKSILPQLLAI